MENTQHSHHHPTGRPCHCDTPGDSDSPKAPRFQSWKRAIYSSASQLSNNSNQTENQLTLHSQSPNNGHAHTQGSTPANLCAHRHIRTALHMLKPLSCCLLSHYSIACYFLKQEKAIYPQRSAERFATRLSLGIWEVTLKFEECGEV